MKGRKTLKDFECGEKLFGELREEAREWIEDIWETAMNEGEVEEAAHLETLRECEGAKKVLELFFGLQHK